MRAWLATRRLGRCWIVAASVHRRVRSLVRSFHRVADSLDEAGGAAQPVSAATISKALYSRQDNVVAA